MPRLTEQGRWQVLLKVAKYKAGEERPYTTLFIKDNLLLNEGINLMWDLITGSAGTSYNNANARIGVGTSSAGAVASQTGLQGGTFMAPMAAGYPLRTDQTVDFQGTFGTGSANFPWEEWSIDNGSTGTVNLKRKVANMGTKTSTEIWVLTASITLS